MKALFICSDRESWKGTIGFFRDFLEEVELFCARNGKDALDIIVHESPISVVIIDDLLQGEDQIQLAESIVETAGQKPIIFLGPDEKIKELLTTEFFGLYSTNEVLEKPYEFNELKEKVLKAIEWDKEKAGGDAHKTGEEEYVPVTLKSFYMHNKVSFDVYYEVYSNNYMKVITKNKKYTESTIQNLAKKNIKQLFLTKTEKIKFLEESMGKAIEVLATAKNQEAEKIFSTQICAVMLVHEMINQVGVTDSVKELSELIVSTVSIPVKKHKTFNELASQIPITYGDMGEQATYMLYLCHYMTVKLGWESEMTFKKLGLACILHDCKLKYDDLSLVTHEADEKLKEFNLHSLNIFKEHAKLAEKVAAEFNNFPDCGFIILEHHTPPEKKYSVNMNSISCLFCLVRMFTTQLANFGFTTMGIKSAIPFIKPYDFGGFKKIHDTLIELYLKN